ncbi:MAG TPA: hypothetical protein VN657_04230 [Nitrospiraceae bacterium]|nr:hypothetical protein [Nitrospiraceae bacterium]
MTASPPILEAELLGGLPVGLKNELMAAYAEVLRNFRERRWEPAELNGGKLCEVVYSILKGYVEGKYPNQASKPKNMVDACRDLEKTTGNFSRSVKIQVPRMLLALYEVRNNRGVGHVGGDVDPNHMDATCVLEMSKWVMSELVRIFHKVSTESATAAVDALVERTLPIVWKVGTNLRVLDTKMLMGNKVLVLLYHSRGTVKEAELLQWVEHSNASVFRRDILRRAHKAKLVEYDPTNSTVEISPLGIEHVERILLK